MDISLTLILIFTLIIFIIIFTFISYKIINNNINDKYKQLPFNSYYTKKSKNIKKCPHGCVRGRCDYNKYCKDHFPPYPKCCAFDFQCNYCKDVDTGMYYIQPGYDDNIEYKYNKKMNQDQTDLFNDQIRENNKYIRRINKKINKINYNNGY